MSREYGYRREHVINITLAAFTTPYAKDKERELFASRDLSLFQLSEELVGWKGTKVESLLVAGIRHFQLSMGKARRSRLRKKKIWSKYYLICMYRNYWR